MAISWLLEFIKRGIFPSRYSMFVQDVETEVKKCQAVMLKNLGPSNEWPALLIKTGGRLKNDSSSQAPDHGSIVPLIALNRLSVSTVY